MTEHSARDGRDMTADASTWKPDLFAMLHETGLGAFSLEGLIDRLERAGAGR